MSINLTAVRTAAHAVPAAPDHERVFRPATEYLSRPRPATGRTVAAYLAAAERHGDVHAGAYLYREARAAVVGIPAMRAATEYERDALVSEVCATITARGKLESGDTGRWYLRQTARTIMRDSRAWLDAAEVHRSRAQRRDGDTAPVVMSMGAGASLAANVDVVAWKAGIALDAAEVALVPASLAAVAGTAADALLPASMKGRAAKHRNVTARLVQRLAGLAGIDAAAACVDHGRATGRTLAAVRSQCDRGEAVLADMPPLAVITAVRAAAVEHGCVERDPAAAPATGDAAKRAELVADCAGAVRDLIRELGGRDVESIGTQRGMPAWNERRIAADDMPRPATGRDVARYLARRYAALYREPTPPRERGTAARPVDVLPPRRERGTASYRHGRSPLLPATASGAPVGGAPVPRRTWREGTALIGWTPAPSADAVALAAKVAAKRAEYAARQG